VTEFHQFATDQGLTPDPGQENIAAALNAVYRYIAAPPKKSFFRTSKPPKGIYIWGGVGRGKTMMMDLFFNIVPTTQKRRVHFNIFMLDVHSNVKLLRETGQGKDPLQTIAKRIAKDTDLLCFDEFQVYDIADAMVLSELFRALFAAGVIVIATSNVAPDDLYKGGLQRARFEPFIPLVKQAMQVMHLDSPTDYRQQALRDDGVYFIQDEAKMTALFDKLVGGQSAASDPRDLDVQGRSLHIEKSVGKHGWISFSELCEKPRGAVDYQALATTYHTIFINHVPRMGYDRRNECKRFIILIDTLYDARRRVVINAAVPPQDLYDGQDHAFEFDRTISRLLEMQGDDYFLRTSLDNVDNL